MKKLLLALPVVAALGGGALFAQPASAHENGSWQHMRWHQSMHHGHHYGWDQGHHYGWNKKRCTFKRVYNERRDRWERVQVCRSRSWR